MRGRNRTVRSTRRANPFRKRLVFPELDAREIADHVQGHCLVFVIKTQIGGGPWRIEFQIQLKLEKQVKDHGYDAVKLRRGLWIGFDGEKAVGGWLLSRASITESTLTLGATYRELDWKRLQTARQVRISHLERTPLGIGGVLLEVRDMKMYGPSGRA